MNMPSTKTPTPYKFSISKAFAELIKTIRDPSKSDVEFGINFMSGPLLAYVPRPILMLVRKRYPSLGRLYDEAYDPIASLTALEALPKGTLGHEYVRFVRENNITPLAAMFHVGRGGRGNLLRYMAFRAYKLHDILHVVMDCEATVIGEVRVVSFSLAQSSGGGPAAIALLVLLLHLALKEPRSLWPAIKLVRQWYGMGHEYGLHWSFRFEERWDQPVEVVREALRQHEDPVPGFLGRSA